MSVNGRPKKEFNVEDFEKLCHIQCTKDEIAGWFNFSDDTLERRIKEEYDSTFAVVFKQKREGGRISLRRAQWQKAVQEKNVAMLIWLGKQMLGQTDKLTNSNEQKPLNLNYNLNITPKEITDAVKKVINNVDSEPK